MEVISNLLRLRITFQWQPIIDNTIIETIRLWATDDETDPPYLLILSRIFMTLSTHNIHMRLHDDDFNERYGPVAHAAIRRRQLSTLPEETQRTCADVRPISKRQPDHLA